MGTLAPLPFGSHFSVPTVFARLALGAESISRTPVLRLTPRAPVVGSGRSLEGAETVRLGEMEEGARGGVSGEKGQVSGPWMELEEPAAPGGFSRGRHGHLRQGAGLGGRAGPGEGSELQQGQ